MKFWKFNRVKFTLSNLIKYNGLGGNMCIVQTRQLKKVYKTGNVIVKALDGIDIRITKGEFVSIAGASGSGKSTLLHLLGGLDTPSDGTVWINGKNIYTLPSDELTIFRRREIGFVFQSYNLVPVLSVYENIVLPLQLDGKEVNTDFFHEVTMSLEITDLLDRLPGQLSGGQQQRVAIARALITEPAIVLADEPTGNLDTRTSSEVINFMQVASRRFNQTLVMITHNDSIAKKADRMLLIEDGKLRGGT